MPSKRLYSVSSHSSDEMGRFALVAQATRLLGQVLRHVMDTSLERTFHEEEALLLNETLTALMKVISVEGELQQLSVMNQTNICSMYDSQVIIAICARINILQRFDNSPRIVGFSEDWTVDPLQQHPSGKISDRFSFEVSGIGSTPRATQIPVLCRRRLSILVQSTIRSCYRKPADSSRNTHRGVL